MDGKAHLAVRFVQDLLGLSRMADASRGLTYHLVDVVQWHIHEDTYADAHATIIDAHLYARPYRVTLAHSRLPIEVMRSGWAVSQVQALQHAPTISS